MLKHFFIFVFIFLGINSFAAIAVQNGLTHQYKVENGKVYKGKIVIQNMADLAQNVKFYVQDQSYHFNGSTHYADPSVSAKRSNAAWIKLSTNFIVLGKKEKMEVPFEIFVPDSLQDAGSYWSVIMVEPVEDIKPNQKPGFNIVSVVRYAIQIITDFKSDELNPQLKFENVSINKQDSVQQVLTVAISNQGKVFCMPTTIIELYKKSNGEKVGVFSSSKIGILPDNSKSVNINMGNIAPGDYTAVIISTDENENAFALKAALTIK